ncbi:MAG: helix-turn-helix transcriptional regulator [Thaumarchaeota archaeon]|nr:helix-turn-helix transcriptional regulator [Nitrososphaerota archaeon]
MLGKRWTIEITRQLFLGDSKFNELLRNTPGVNPRMLSLRLKELEEYGLVSRSVSNSSPVEIRYELTGIGRDIVPVMYSMAEFTMKNFPVEVFDDGVSRTPLEVTNEIGSNEKRRRHFDF